jgi:hypothetical protein
MWVVANKTPYTADRTWVQDKHANKLWLVVVKATFDVGTDGSTRIANEQLPVLQMGKHVSEPGKSSLAYEGDLFGVKTGTDVLVKGCAWTPVGKPVPAVDVDVNVGPIRKRLRIVGDRLWERNLMGALVPSPARLFEQMPIQYERAYGGWDRASAEPADYRLDPRNPVGTGFATSLDHSQGMRLPNIEYHNQIIRSWKDRPDPAGLNAVECHWSPRRELAGTYDDRWLQERFPLWAEDFDQRYNSCAPLDQQVQGFLRGGEAVHLSNLSPNGDLSFHLPKVFLGFETRFGQKRLHHRGELCTLILEPEIPRVIMIWQMSFVCNDQVDELDMTVVTEKRTI